jgi:bacterioferritin (cytochrome b1)
MNYSGAMTSPEGTNAMIEATQHVPATTGDSDLQLAAMRSVYIDEAEPIGTVPEPMTSVAMDQAAMPLHLMLIGKLGARLAFERTGTRLYEALLLKVQSVQGQAAAGPSAEDVRRLRDEEYQHFLLLQEAITQLGGDPTAVTPMADVCTVASTGILQVLTDPRTSVDQCLDAMLTAELADNDAWRMLIDVSIEMQQTELANRFERALADEADHLDKVRGWILMRAREITGLNLGQGDGRRESQAA